MDNFTNVINRLLQLLIEMGNLIVGWILRFEMWLRSELAQLGLPPNIQTVILVVLAILLILGALRLFGGLIRVAVVLVLILIASQILLPLVQR